MIALQERTVTLQFEDRAVDVPALAIGGFAVHRRYKLRNGEPIAIELWNVTHIASGRTVNQRDLSNQDTAIAIALMLAGSGIEFPADFPAGASVADRFLAGWIGYAAAIVTRPFPYDHLVARSESPSPIA